LTNFCFAAIVRLEIEIKQEENIMKCIICDDTRVKTCILFHPRKRAADTPYREWKEPCDCTRKENTTSTSAK
jgi:hypothetical protein